MLALIAGACADAVTGPPSRTDIVPDRDLATAQATTIQFLPPLAHDAALTAPPDPNAMPLVRVCSLESPTDPTAACHATVGMFTRDAADGSFVKFDPDSMIYHANWRTPEGPGLYRIVVSTIARSGMRERGSLVVRLTNRSGQAANGLPVFQGGRTLPIAFRLAVVKLEPEWSLLAASPTTGEWRSSAVIVPEENAVYASYGESPMSLWRFDLTSDTWSEIRAMGAPTGLQTRRIVHDPMTHELLTFAEGLGPVFAVAEGGGAWRQLASYPGSSEYNEPVAFWHPVAQRLAFVGGYGFFTWHDQMWSYDRATDNWSQLAQSSSRPMPRFAADGAIDEAAGLFYLTGGQGYPTGSQYDGIEAPNDLWRLDFASNTWTRIMPVDHSQGPTSLSAGFDVVPSARALYRFGGLAAPGPVYNGVWEIRIDGSTQRDALERLDLDVPEEGWKPVTAPGDSPSARWSANVFYDELRHRLLVVGGTTITGAFLDVHALLLQ